MPSSSGESRGDDTSEKGRRDTNDGRVVTEGSACSCGPTGVSLHDEQKSRTGDEIGGVGAVKGVNLGGVGIQGDDGTSSSGLATSLVGSAAGTGFTQSVGRGVGGP